MKDELHNEDELEDTEHISIIQFFSDEISYHMDAIKEIEDQLKYFQDSDGLSKTTPAPFNYDTGGVNLIDDYEDIIYIYEEEEEEEDVEEED
jgi:hypothetical protein